MKLIITRGLPGSGKTTRAKSWVKADPEHRVRINRDDLRAMAHESVYIGQSDGNPGTERSIVSMRDAAVRAALKRNLDVVVDDTNLPSRVVRDLRRVATLAGAEFEIWDYSDVPLEVCLRNNRYREDKDPVPTSSIKDMYERFIHGKGYPLPVADEPATPDLEIEPYVQPDPDLELPEIVISDIDGTVCFMGTRSPFDETRVHEDRPNEHVLEALELYRRDGYQIVFISGRTDGCREATEVYLKEHCHFPYLALHMRAAGDMRKDSEVKLEIFNREIRDKYSVRLVFDDRNQVVELWRALGLTCFQVAEGDF